MPKFLIDASSLFKLLSAPPERVENILENSSITDLTIFEMGNVLWKRKDSKIKDISLEKVMAFSEFVANILSEITTFSIEAIEIPNILAVAIRSKATFYDASYIYICTRENLGLISEDSDLRKKARMEKIEVIELEVIFSAK